MKLLVIGGVAAGASAAARARRLDETAEIILFERGEFISFANCGLPYHVGNVIPERSSLLVMTPAAFRKRTAIDVRVQHEVTRLDPARKCIAARDLHSGQSYEESYDKLILATGASPIRPDLPGIDDPDVFQLWTIPDLDRIKARVDAGASRAVVVGAGFIGLEVAENLRQRGLQVTVVEMLPQVLPSLDPEMAQLLAAEVRQQGVTLLLGRRVTALSRRAAGGAPAAELTVALDDGQALTTDLVVLSIGVRPNSELARAAGLVVGRRGGVCTDAHLRTSDPHVYAVGDVAEVKDLVGGEPVQVPLAGPANREGRIAADNVCGRSTIYRGAQGTAIVKVFGLAAASTGRNERALRAAQTPFLKVYTHPASHASYYPGAKPLAMKLLFRQDGRILGAQVVGAEGVDKRIDVLATALRGGLTVYGLEELELAYAPPYGSAKDPVNFLGMVAANALRGDSRPVHRGELPAGALLLDVREPAERELGTIPGSAFIPLGELRSRLQELPRDRQIVVFCKVGLRGYIAERILRQNGFDACNLSGGITTWKLAGTDAAGGTPAAALPPAAPAPAPSPAPSAAPAVPKPPDSASTAPPAANPSVDVSCLQCPGPLVRVRQEVEALPPGGVLAVHAAATFRADLEAWCRCTGHQLLQAHQVGDTLDAVVRKVADSATTPAVAAPAAAVPAAARPDSAAIVVFSNDLDKVLAAFIIATGLASLGGKVTLFFTFWGLNVLRRDAPPLLAKDFLSRMFGLMMPRGARRLALSKLHMLGMGTAMMKHVMAQKRVPSLPDLITQAHALGVRFVACDMAMNVMGLRREELIDSVDEIVGVASFAALARDSQTVLFI